MLYYRQKTVSNDGHFYMGPEHNFGTEHNFDESSRRISDKTEDTEKTKSTMYSNLF